MTNKTTTEMAKYLQAHGIDPDCGTWDADTTMRAAMLLAQIDATESDLVPRAPEMVNQAYRIGGYDVQ